MSRELNLSDIQGNIVRAYGRFRFPFSRYYFFHFPSAASGRAFIDSTKDLITTAARWPKNEHDLAYANTAKAQMQARPKCTTNVAFSFRGLLALDTPIETLKNFPEEFVSGMKARAFLLGDRDQTKTEEDAGNWCAHWDPIWKKNAVHKLGGKNDVHMLVTLNAQVKKAWSKDPHEALENRASLILSLAKKAGVVQLKGNGRDGNAEYESGSAVFEKIHDNQYYPTPNEHFGFTDGIGDPCFEGQYADNEMADKVIGRGKINGLDKNGEIIWEPIAAGEFLLGHPDEGQELPHVARPREFMLNGSFLSYRKLHQNVATFEAVIEEEAQDYAKIMGVSENIALETIKAKMCGRWSDGVPLSLAPDFDSWIQYGIDNGFRKKNDDNENIPGIIALKYIEYLKSSKPRNFRFADDMTGAKCPLGAHLRRVNTRDYLDPLNNYDRPNDDEFEIAKPNPNATSALNKRRRILRRGLPYGPSIDDEKTDDTEQGIIMLVVCASLFRQFEFVQQQWIQYGLDFHQGNSTCPLLGDHTHFKRFVIEGDERKNRPPYVMSKLKTFVECRGGEYFFIPSMSALNILSMGIVDPT